jgi:hypothetical protein
MPKRNKACGRLVRRKACNFREALRRAGTGPVQDGRVARVEKILAEPVIQVDPGLSIFIENEQEEVRRL